MHMVVRRCFPKQQNGWGMSRSNFGHGLREAVIYIEPKKSLDVFK